MTKATMPSGLQQVTDRMPRMRIVIPFSRHPALLATDPGRLVDRRPLALLVGALRGAERVHLVVRSLIVLEKQTSTDIVDKTLDLIAFSRV
jgi:hypothetical protein